MFALGLATTLHARLVASSRLVWGERLGDRRILLGIVRDGPSSLIPFSVDSARAHVRAPTI